MGQAVMSVVAFGKTIYVASQTHSGYGGDSGSGQVWRYDGGRSWTKVGDNLGTSCMSLVAFENQLYAVCTDTRAVVNNDFMGKLYRYDGTPLSWTFVAGHRYYDASTSAYCWGFSSAIVSSIRGIPEIFIADLGKDSFYRYNTSQGLKQIDENWGSGVPSLSEFTSQLFAGCRFGKFYQSIDGIDFSKRVDLVNLNHVFGTSVFNNTLYVGTANSSSGVGLAELRRWNGTSLDNIVATWAALSPGDGITSLAGNGTVIYVGLGIREGYYPGNSTKAEVWTYDGTRTALISDPDFFGGGVQILSVVAPIPSTLDLLSMSVKPTDVLAGGNVLLEAVGNGFGVFTNETALNLDLPRGWTSQALFAPNDGTGTFSYALIVPSGERAGKYNIRARLNGTDIDGNIISSGQKSVSVTVVNSIPPSQSVTYSNLQEGILQTRAWKLNLNDTVISAGIPKYTDLTSVGVSLKQETTKIEGRSGYISRYWYRTLYTTDGINYSTYEQSSYSVVNDQTNAIASRMDGVNTYQSGSYNSRYEYNLETRPFFSFNIDLPDGVPAGSTSRVLFSTGEALPIGTYDLGLNDLSSASLSDGATAFADAALGALLSSYSLVQKTSNSLDTTSWMPGFGPFLMAFAILDKVNPKETFYYTDSVGGAYITSYGNYQSIFVNYDTGPKLFVTSTRGYKSDEILQLMLNDIRTADGSKAVSIGQLVNSYGKNPTAWAIR